MHHFSAGGLYNGLVLLIDDETRTYWDHITGEAVHGPLAGQVLATWNTPITSVGAALKSDPALEIATSRPPLLVRLFGGLFSKLAFGKGFLPPGFRSTMGPVDARLPELEHGLGVVDGKRARFYPMRAIGSGAKDDIDGRALTLGVGADDGVPFAAWEDGARPMQLFLRWYGFVSTWPHAEIFAPVGGSGL